MSKQWLLDIEDNAAVFSAVKDYLKAHPGLTKVKKGTELTLSDGKKVKLKNSFIGVLHETIINDQKKSEYNIYAVANAKVDGILGEGAYGIVKIAQDNMGNNFAIKIEDVTEIEEVANENELKIMKAIGYLRDQVYREKDNVRKKTTITELREGKDLYTQLYTNILRAGQLYEPGSPERKNALSETQRKMIAIKCCLALDDLHKRGIIHGDIKPANFMVNVNGDQIIVGSIDFGFSFELDPNNPDKPIEVKGIPKGTHTDYMPPEVKKGKDGGEALFSQASDVFSLGKMFAEDLQLPEIAQQMLNPEAKDRASLPSIARTLAESIANDPNLEAKKLAHEILHGVKRIKENERPREIPSYIAQLMSGFRDPRESKGRSAPTSYQSDDFDKMAAIIYAQMTPEDMFKQLSEGFDVLVDDDDKDVYLHNAGIFLTSVLKQHANDKYHNATVTGVNAFVEKIKNDSPLLASKLQQEMTAVEAKQKSRKENIEQSKNRVQGAVSIDASILPSLAARTSVRVVLGKLGGKTDPAVKKVAKDMADDFLILQQNLLKQLPLTDCYNGEVNDAAYYRENILNQMTIQTERIQQMVISDILSASTKQQQIRIAELYLNVAKECLKNGDVATSQSIVSGFQNTTISRLSYLLEGKSKKLFNQYDELFSPTNYSKNMRLFQDELAQSGKLAVPSITLFSQNIFKAFGTRKRPKDTNSKKLDEASLMLEADF